jgi:DNA-binding SARP family transcriptional activator
LRKLLACEAAVSVADRHASLDARFVWVDAWALERLLEPLVPVGAPAANADRLEAAAPRALALFGGPFLAEAAAAPWALPTRDRLAGRMQRFAALLGAHREETRQWQGAGELYQRMIELDPLAESFYRRQMICLQAQARRAEAIEVFRRCRQMLSTRLGIAPGRDTEQVYQELVAS